LWSIEAASEVKVRPNQPHVVELQAEMHREISRMEGNFGRKKNANLNGH
jgi:hypothetical protein